MASHLPNHYVYGVGGSGYYGPENKSSVEAICSTMSDVFVSGLQGDAGRPVISLQPALRPFEGRGRGEGARQSLTLLRGKHKVLPTGPSC